MCKHKHRDTQAAVNYFDALKKYKLYADKKKKNNPKPK